MSSRHKRWMLVKTLALICWKKWSSHTLCVSTTLARIRSAWATCSWNRYTIFFQKVAICGIRDYNYRCHIRHITHLWNIHSRQTTELTWDTEILASKIFHTSQFCRQIKGYTRTSENNLPSARTWSVNNILCSQKIHRHLEIPKIDSIMSCLP